MVQLIAWLNLAVLVLSSVFFLFFYVMSVSPARLERRLGEKAFRRCMHYRIASGVLEGVTVLSYVIYWLYPLPIGFPLVLPWSWLLSIAIALVIAAPSTYLMYIGVRDAGRETLEPKKEHTMYGGIYERMRHPQALGEFLLWFPIALVLNSPFLLLYSFVWIPIFYIMCVFEERDLLIRYGQAYEEYRKRVGFFPRKR